MSEWVDHNVVSRRSIGDYRLEVALDRWRDAPRHDGSVGWCADVRLDERATNGDGPRIIFIAQGYPYNSREEAKRAAEEAVTASQKDGAP